MKIKDNQVDYNDLKRAVNFLQSPTITAQISGFIGSPIETAIKKLPKSVSQKIQGSVEVALSKAADGALWSMENTPGIEASTKTHKIMAGVFGALGGAFGFAALFAELPATTIILMRSVADVARSEGFSLDDISTKHACIEVFAFGGNTKADDGSDTGYYTTRAFTTEAMKHLAKELSEIAARQAAQETAHAVRAFTGRQAGRTLGILIEKVAQKFGVTITSKFAAQAVPIIGAVFGASLNMLFADFYQDIARGHFIVKRLEDKYGFDVVKAEYEALCPKKA